MAAPPEDERTSWNAMNGKAGLKFNGCIAYSSFVEDEEAQNRVEVVETV